MFLTDTPQYKAIVEEIKYITRLKNFLCERSYDFDPKYFIKSSRFFLELSFIIIPNIQ